MNGISTFGTIVVLVLVPAGCASLDPAADVGRAAALVSDRAGTLTGWDAPWDQASDAWDGTSDLSSDAAVLCALQNNRSIRAQVEMIGAARADFVQAHLLPNPMANLAFGFPVESTMSGTMINAMLMQPLSWLWTREPRIDGAGAALEGRILALSDAALSLVAEVRTAHARVAILEGSVDLERRNLDLVTDMIALTESLFAAGEASQFDLNRLAVDRGRLEALLADRESELAVAKRDLLHLIGRASDEVTWRTDGAVPMNVLDHLDEPSVINLAVTQRIDVAASRHAVEKEEADVVLAERGRIPAVGAGGMFEQEMSGNTMAGPAFQVELPIFDDNRAAVARARSEHREAVIRADETRERAIAEVRRAWIMLSAARDVLDIYDRDIISLAEDNFALAQLTFEAGESDLTTLLDTERQLLAARIEFASRRIDVAEQYFELERAAGGTFVPIDVAKEPEE